MAYGRRSQSRRSTARRTGSYRASPRRTNNRRAPARRVRRTAARGAPQTVRIVIQQAPQPSLSSPSQEMVEKAKVARF